MSTIFFIVLYKPSIHYIHYTCFGGCDGTVLIFPNPLRIELYKCTSQYGEVIDLLMSEIPNLNVFTRLV